MMTSKFIILVMVGWAVILAVAAMQQSRPATTRASSELMTFESADGKVRLKLRPEWKAEQAKTYVLLKRDGEKASEPVIMIRSPETPSGVDVHEVKLNESAAVLEKGLKESWTDIKVVSDKDMQFGGAQTRAVALTGKRIESDVAEKMLAVVFPHGNTMYTITVRGPTEKVEQVRGEFVESLKNMELVK